MPELVAADDVKLNYMQVGTGDDLVLLHGLGANLSFWYFGAARSLAEGRNVLMFDMRGHGRSSMPDAGYDLRTLAGDLAALLDHHGIERADIAGHSFGGIVGLAFASLYPERVRTLIIADSHVRGVQPPTRLADWPHWEQWKAHLCANGLEDPPSDQSLIDYKLLASLSQYTGGPGAGAAPARPVAPRKRIGRAREMGEKGLQRWQQLLANTTAGRDFEDESLIDPDRISEVEVPTLLMFGRLSHCLPSADGLLTLLPDARLVVVPGAGHFFPLVKHQFFARAVDLFLARQAGAVTPLRRGRRRLREARRLRAMTSLHP
ncbi:alpha/beta fold hydrolase [Acuticoccus sp. I52.16.1]|uniref:alpha/beta fold hydrolase n=1 Tax=Acuticoccus sp. I52.16.1 TaxID=2928472 RepID=UPI001FD04AF1|nr:alpha/beta hydrolase [Acuticoccus sp. I52.16.1]UOM32854.1 alpha/beta hydrolase [Acuticoccus sp. I52.16.1]